MQVCNTTSPSPTFYIFYGNTTCTQSSTLSGRVVLGATLCTGGVAIDVTAVRVRIPRIRKFDSSTIVGIFQTLLCLHYIPFIYLIRIYIYTNVSECDDYIRYTAPSNQIDREKICKLIDGSEKRWKNCQICDVLGTRTRTTVTSMATPRKYECVVRIRKILTNAKGFMKRFILR